MADVAASSNTNGMQRPSRPTALSETQYGLMTNDSDAGTPSDESSTEQQEEFPTDDVQSLVGLSIGRAQTRLTSPKTPAAEKAAVLDDLDGGELFTSGWPVPVDGTLEERGQQTVTVPIKSHGEQLSSQKTYAEPFPTYVDAPESPVYRMPSPWAPGVRPSQKTEGARASFREALNAHRRKASSSFAMPEALKKYIPSLPRNAHILGYPIPGLSSAPDDNDEAENAVDPRPYRPSTATTWSDRWEETPFCRNRSHSNTSASQRYATMQETRGSPLISTALQRTTSGARDDYALPLSPSRVSRQKSKHPGLRRSASDQSLGLQRSLSRVSSLGDDSRFEHVQGQVNSRLKAIKDSWQDSNFKLPSLPTMSNRGFGSYRADLIRARDGTSSLRDPPRGTWPVDSRQDPSSAGVHANGTLKQPSTTAGMSGGSAASHPFFTQALNDVTGDLVVLGGYRGSILRSAEPPYRQLWAPIKIGVNLRKVDLEVGLDPRDEETMEERVKPGGMLTHIGPVDMSRRLLKRLRASENAKNGTLRVHNYGYDWRLSPHLLSRKLIQFLEGLACNAPGTPSDKRGATIIAHSLGGLITRHAVNQRPELFAGVVYAGVPRSCVNILGPLRNGDDVLLSSRVLTAQVNFTIRTSFALLPLDGRCFIDKNTREEYPVDFFDPQTWIDYCLSPCVARPLPPLNAPPPGFVSSIFGTVTSSMASVLPSFPVTRRGSISSKTSNSQPGSIREKLSSAAKTTAAEAESGGAGSGIAPQMGGNASSNPAEYGADPNASVSTAVTIPREAAIAYLTRTLAEVKAFKEETAFIPSHAEKNLYPPVAVIYGKSTPTVYGAKVAGREGIKRADAYEELAFASGDGVVLAKSAMVPEGYQVMRRGIVASERGHVTLLGDLEAVGRCLNAVIVGRKAGIGVDAKGDTS
ncbi:hypothetical protein H2201_002758 [Coniosporium apollinis]|uniref:AB hydrolase-1 domain-containing protein n=1 Tax=Coniosporium apollinis TaxID=61459 RepID=A0ABQ9P4D0_9PEZI|nr:hypothetical protein H2201_002758 [Coniosporium apollinis]